MSIWLSLRGCARGNRRNCLKPVKAHLQTWQDLKKLQWCYFMFPLPERLHVFMASWFYQTEGEAAVSSTCIPEMKPNRHGSGSHEPFASRCQSVDWWYVRHVWRYIADEITHSAYKRFSPFNSWYMDAGVEEMLDERAECWVLLLCVWWGLWLRRRSGTVYHIRRSPARSLTPASCMLNCPWATHTEPQTVGMGVFEFLLGRLTLCKETACL